MPRFFGFLFQPQFPVMKQMLAVFHPPFQRMPLTSWVSASQISVCNFERCQMTEVFRQLFRTGCYVVTGMSQLQSGSSLALMGSILIGITGILSVLFLFLPFFLVWRTFLFHSVRKVLVFIHYSNQLQTFLSDAHKP